MDYIPESVYSQVSVLTHSWQVLHAISAKTYLSLEIPWVLRGPAANYLSEIPWVLRGPAANYLSETL